MLRRNKSNYSSITAAFAYTVVFTMPRNICCITLLYFLERQMFGNFFWYSNYNKEHSNKEDTVFLINGFNGTEEKLFGVLLKN